MRKFITVLTALVIMLSLAAPIAMAATEPTTETTVATTTASEPVESIDAIGESIEVSEGTETEAIVDAPLSAPAVGTEQPTAPDTSDEELASSQLKMIIFSAVVGFIALIAIILIFVKKKNLKETF